MMKSPNGTEPQNAPLNTEILKTDRATVVKVNGVGVASLPFRENCADSFQWNADKNVWIITRTSAVHCTDMTIDLQSVVTKTIPAPEGTKYVQNTSLPAGTQKDTVKARTGYVVETYQVWYKNGEEVSRNLLCTSTYKAYQKTVEYN